MNERIKKLADNATHYANGVCDADPIPNWYETRDQKFAELIVEECVKLNGKELAMAGHSRMVDVYCEHFGIEY